MSRWKPKVRIVRRTVDPASSPWASNYEDLGVELLDRCEAAGIVLLVLQGNRGHGLQSSFKAGAPYSDLDMPALLRRMADTLEAGRKSDPTLS